MSNEFGYIPESPEQSFGNNKGIFTPKDIYDLTRADKYTNYGQLELIETQTYSSGVAYIDFTSINGTNYNVHFLTFNGLSTTVAGVSLFSIRYSTDGGSSFVSSGYQNAYQDGISSGSFNENRSTSESGLRIGFSYSTTLTSGYVYLYNLNNSSKYSFNSFHSIQDNSRFTFGSGVYPTANTVNAIRVYDVYSLDSGTVSLYGIKEYS
jgi:hypothetical protein